MDHKINNGASPKELNGEMIGWIASEEGEKAIIADIETKWELYPQKDDRPLGAGQRDRIYARVRKAVDHRQVRRSLWKRSARWVAAAVILIAAGSWLWIESPRWLFGREDIPRYVADVRLTLPDGAEVILDSSTENSLIAEQGDVTLIRENGCLIHEKQLTRPSAPARLQWGTVDVPRGTQFDMVLEDGTRVWLNAGSRLRFPIAFAGKERRVHLEGEAYFDVKEDKQKPFIVETAWQNVRVLGTEFNVYAYKGDAAEFTTLVEGSVSVSAGVDSEAVVIAPGQQAAVFAETSRIAVRGVDTSEIAGWRDGLFVFDGNTFDEVFRKLSRWYGFEYSFEDESMARLTFRGNLNRPETVVPIFEIMEAMARIRIDVKGDMVTIKRK